MHWALSAIAFMFVASYQVSGRVGVENVSGRCLNKICPVYSVLPAPNAQGYEIRRYMPSVWVETTRKQGERALDIFPRLMRYLKGNNAEAKRIPMALPVVGHMKISQNPGPSESMRFYLGADTGSFNPPRPSDPDVHLHHDPAMTYYVMGFRTSHWRNMTVWNEKARNLKTLTRSTHNEYCGAGYGPHGRGQKYNEIWIHTSANHSDHHYHHHRHNDAHDHHHGDHNHQHDDEHGHDHGGDHNH